MAEAKVEQKRNANPDQLRAEAAALLAQADKNELTQRTGGTEFSEPPRYRVVTKAYMSGVKVLKGKDFVAMDDALLDPEEQPITTQLSGLFGGNGAIERAPLVIEFHGIPGTALEPMNEAAQYMVDHVDALLLKAQAETDKAEQVRRARLGKRSRNPIDTLIIQAPVAG